MEQFAKEDLVKLATLGLEDPVWFLQTFLARWFPSTVPWVHRGILAILTRKTAFLLKYGELDKIVKYFVWREDPSDPKSLPRPMFRLEDDGKITLLISQFTLIMMPRGFSKTTLCNGFVIYNVCYKLHLYMVYLSETATHAEAQLRKVRNQFEGNAKLLTVFGQMKPAERTGKKWSEELIECLNGVVIGAKGRGAQIRGSNEGEDSSRPSLIIFDDVEDKESVATEPQRQKTLDWFLSDVVPALPTVGEAKANSSILGLGTLLNGQALLAKLAVDPEWTAVVFGATVGEENEPLWSAALTIEELARKRAFYARQGKLSSFYMEYYNAIRNDESAIFKPENIIVPANFDPTEFVYRALAWDPAFSDNKDADFAAQAVVGMSERGRLAVLDLWLKRGASTREQIDNYFLMAARWKVNKHGVESQAQQKAMVHILREEMFRRHSYFEIIEITHGSAKVPRVEGILQPRYASKYIVHAREFPEYNAMLLDWPNGKKDGPDVVAMAVALLDPYAAAGADDVDLGEDEYESLEDVIEGEWRHAP